MTNSQLTNGNCQPTKDQQSADSFPNFSVGEEQVADRFLGELFLVLPLFRLFMFINRFVFCEEKIHVAKSIYWYSLKICIKSLYTVNPLLSPPWCGGLISFKQI